MFTYLTGGVKAFLAVCSRSVSLSWLFFPTWRFRELTRRFLLDLKSGAERRAAGS